MLQAHVRLGAIPLRRQQNSIIVIYDKKYLKESKQLYSRTKKKPQPILDFLQLPADMVILTKIYIYTIAERFG